jgi:PhnB protein
MEVQAYLFFEGKTDEALAYYSEKIGAKVEALMRFEECPAKEQMPEAMWPKVMHSNFRVGNTQIMASDGNCGGAGEAFTGFALTINVETDAEAEHLFNALAADGRVEMAMGPTFFATRYGMLVDKFGVTWMVINPIRLCSRRGAYKPCGRRLLAWARRVMVVIFVVVVAMQPSQTAHRADGGVRRAAGGGLRAGEQPAQGGGVVAVEQARSGDEEVV